MPATWMVKMANLLRDPIMMNWAIQYYAKFEGGEQKEWMEDNWFTTPTLRYWIKRDDEITLGNMFRFLPRPCFAGLAPLIAERWDQYPLALTRVASNVLATVVPETAARVFQQYVEQAPELIPVKALGILQNLYQLPPERAKPILEKLLPYVPIFCRCLPGVLEAGLVAAMHAWPEVVADLIDCMFAQTNHFDPGAAAVGALLGNLDYINDRIFDPANTFCYSSASVYFEDGAPLAEMDHAIEEDNPLPPAMALWRPYRERSEAGKKLWDGLVNCKSYANPAYAKQLTSMAFAMLAKQIERPHLDFIERMDTSGLLHVAVKDINFDAHFDHFLACLRKHPRENVVNQIKYRITLGYYDNANRKLYARGRAHRLMRLAVSLGWEEFIGILIHCLEPEYGTDERIDAAQALKLMGKPAGDALIQGWDGFDFDQKSYAAGVIALVGGDGLADLVLARFSEMLGFDEEVWTDLVTVAADVRVLGRLGAELHRKQEHFERVYYHLCALLDVTGKDMNALRKQMRGRHEALLDGLKSAELGPNQVDIARMRLSLKCAECGDANYYDVKKVAIGKPVEKEQMLLADEFPCVSCGAWADFEVGPVARRTVLERIELARRLAPHDHAKYDKIMSLLPHMEVRSQGDQEYKSFPTAYYEMLKKRSLLPHDLATIRRLGAMSRDTNRPRRALKWYREAYGIDSGSIVNIWMLASHLESLGEKTEAFEILVRGVADRENWKIGALHEAQTAGSIVVMFNQLRIALGRQDLPPLSLSAMQTEKPGRNDPCTCGSGKKYKKCCG